MKKGTNWLIGAVFGLAMVVSSTVFAEGLFEDLDLSVSASQSFYTKYVWRGMLLDDDAVAQTDLSISGYGLTVGYWASTDMENEDSLNSEEQDFYVDYTYEFEKVSLSAGYTHYHFPDGDAYSDEAYVAVGFDVLLAPSLTVYYDFGDTDNGGGEGTYVSLGIGHSFELADYVALDLGATLGYNDELFIEGEGFDLGLSAGFTFTLTDNLSVSPSINYSIPFGDLEDENDGAQDDEFFGGVSFSYSF